MRCVIQRVSRAQVTVDGEVVGRVGRGFLVLACAEDGDGEADMIYCADKVIGLRIFEDGNQKMNLSLGDVGGGVLLVSQFTLAGDARHGRRPSFIRAARPEVAQPMLEKMAERLRAAGIEVATGRFQADMQVELVNDGPVTLLLDSRKGF
ncbi:MAG: D-tyrosyl-tRNA(Tyr) deacylase [Clostridiales bacterium]|nr:D-tyrosyl-tRNA(Tyr) deacylase [Clostridiales bacterium]